MNKSKTIIFLLFIEIHFFVLAAQAQYRLNKDKYDQSSYQFERADPYRPIHSIIASSLMPGLGQAIADEPLRGLAFFGIYLASAIPMTQSAGYLLTGEPNLKLSTNQANIIFVTSASTMLLTQIIAAIDAGRVARVNSMALRDKNTRSQLQFYPRVNFSQFYSAPGLEACLVWQL